MRSREPLLVSFGLLACASAIAACSAAPAQAPSEEVTAVESQAQTVYGTLSYYGGPIVANAKIVQVNWNGSIDPTIRDGMGGFYTALTRSELFEWLDTDYATTGNANAGSHAGQPGTNQDIGYGSFTGSFNLGQSAASPVADSAIQTALTTAFDHHTLPAPDANTIYMIQFPPGMIIIDPSVHQSCQTGSFCAYHYKTTYNGQPVLYGVLPDMSQGCKTGCGSDPSYFNNGTAVASHELIEVVTNPGALISGRDYPTSWANASLDPGTSEIGDLCADDHATIAAPQPGGAYYVVQTEHDNASSRCIVSKPSGPPPGANVVAFNQSSATAAAAFVAQDGSVQLTLDSGGNSFLGKAYLSRPGFAPRGAPLAVGVQNGTQIDIFVVANDGAIDAMYHTSTGWNGPVPLTATNFVSPGTALATAPHPGANQLDLFYVNNNGAVSALWSIALGVWNGPVALTANSAAQTKAPLATGFQNSGQLDVLYVGTNGAIDGAWTLGGAWFGPIALSGLNLAPAGAPIATGFQGTQFDVFTVDWAGNVEGVWVRPIDNIWRGPLAITSGGIAGRGAYLTTAQQSSNQLDIFYSDVNGRLDGQGVQGLGIWSAPIALSSNGFAPPGAPIATDLPSTTQLDVLVATGTGLNLTYEQNNGTFNPPSVVYPH